MDLSEMKEGENALEFMHKHYLDQISDQGLYKSTPRKLKSVPESIIKTERIILHTSMSISDIQCVNPMEGTFMIMTRLYLFWEVDLHALGMGEIAERALDTGHYYPMTHVESSKFAELYDIPEVCIFNAVHIEETDPADIRVYGGKSSFTAVMWNKQFNCTCRQRFDIKDFPFDHQNLSIELRLNSPRTWDKFNLTVNLIQFHRPAIIATEWTCHAPVVKRDSPKEKVTIVHLKVVRYAAFYLQNVVAIMFCLSLLGLVSFAMDIADLGSRVSTLLTLLLTGVAFKFILAGTLPKVPYNTLIDYFVMSSMFYVALMTLFCIIP